jgi:hypothetical protein
MQGLQNIKPTDHHFNDPDLLCLKYLIPLFTHTNNAMRKITQATVFTLINASINAIKQKMLPMTATAK